jgi:hypothetical protein
MINLSLRRYLPAWFRSETGDFYLTILFTVAATAELVSSPLVNSTSLVLEQPGTLGSGFLHRDEERRA